MPEGMTVAHRWWRRYHICYAAQTRLKDSPPPDLGHCVDNEGAVREVKSKVFLAFPPLGYATGPRSYTLDYQGLSGSLWFRERLWNVLP